MDSGEFGQIARSGKPEQASGMGNLYGIVQAHIDRYGVREAELARRIGTQPQTVNSWKKRGVRQLPTKALLVRLAEVTGVPYGTVLEAALIDAGYVVTEGDGATRGDGDEGAQAPAIGS